MRIAIDSGPLISGHSLRGIGFHTKNLVESLEKIGVKVDVVDFSKADLKKYDIAHIPSFNPFFLSLPLKKPTKRLILTIHDLIPLIYPKYYPPGIKGKINFWINKFLIHKNVDAIITISETSKKDICRFLGVHPNKVSVSYLAPREVFKPITSHESLITVKKKYDLPDSFVLYVGDVNYNKNLLGLAEACKLIDIPLVIVGKQAAAEEVDRSHIENQPFLKFLKRYGHDPKVARLGFVPDEELAAIYNLASLYCQPSFYEGFGLSILEAFASGCPVVAARTQALVEIAEPAAVFADPKNPKDIAKKISLVLSDNVLRNQLIETGKVYVKNFSWEKTARETLKVYEEVMKK